VRLRSVLRAAVGSATLLAATTGTVLLGDAPAHAAPCARAYTAPIQLGNGQVSVTGELVCFDPNNPADGSPILVTLQVQAGTGWVTLASGAGEALYTCPGPVPRVFRTKELPTRTVTLPCG